jgi:hypothetical protein
MRIGIEVNIAQQEISRITGGRRKIERISLMERIADGLRMPDDARMLLGLAPIGPHTPAKEDPLQRREALKAALATGAAMAGAAIARSDPAKRPEPSGTDLPVGLEAGLGVPPFVRQAFTNAPNDLVTFPAASMDEVHALAESVAALERLDAALGGGALCQMAVNLHGQVKAWLNEGSASASVDAALQRLLTDVGSWVGWLAYDAGNHAVAGRYLTDSIVHARVNDDPAAEVRAMASLCLVLNRIGRHRESLQCAEAALRIAVTIRVPARVVALLHLRAALAQASMGNRAAFGHAASAGYVAFERSDTTREDPPWIHFVNRRELDGLSAYSLMRMGESKRAIDAIRPIVEDPDPAYHRNTVYYRALWAEAAYNCGDYSQASEVGLGVLPAAATVQSKRITNMVMRVARGVEPHTKTVPLARDFVEASRDAALL